MWHLSNRHSQPNHEPAGYLDVLSAGPVSTARKASRHFMLISHGAISKGRSNQESGISLIDGDWMGPSSVWGVDCQPPLHSTCRTAVLPQTGEKAWFDLMQRSTPTGVHGTSRRSRRLVRDGYALAGAPAVAGTLHDLGRPASRYLRTCDMEDSGYENVASTSEDVLPSCRG